MRSIIITTLLIKTIIGIAVCSEEDDESSSKQQYVLNLPFTITGLQETKNDKERLARLEEKMDDILTIVNHISSTCNCEQKTPRSCEELKATQPNASSGYYSILTETGNHRKVYCDMSELCGDSKGWVRMGYLDMSEQIRCPQGFKFSKINNINTCGKPVDHGCQSIKFPSNSISYTKVCGMVTGYQKGLVYALWPRGSSNKINQDYVDGVSITRGSPRKHVDIYGCNIRWQRCPALIMIKYQHLRHLWVMITFVNQAIHRVMFAILFFILLIRYGMEKNVDNLRMIAVRLAVCLGLIEN